MSFRPRAIATLVALISLFAILPAASAAAAVTPSTTPVTSVNLADYGLVARQALPSALNPLGGDTSCASSGSGDVGQQTRANRSKSCQCGSYRIHIFHRNLSIDSMLFLTASRI